MSARAAGANLAAAALLFWLALLGPLITSFLAGTVVLSVGCVRAALVPRWNPWLLVLSIPALVLGGGLALLACVSASQIGIGAALLRGRGEA